MLVLSRKTGERLVLGTDIIVTVVEVKGNRVRLGIQAPKHINVVRGELTEAWHDATAIVHDLDGSGEGDTDH